MNRTRLVSAGGILGIAGLMSLPVSTAHAATGATAAGSADSSALQVQLNPEAVFSMNSTTAALYQQLKPLTDALSGGKGLGSLTLTLDRSRATGALTGDLADVASGHSDSEALAVDFHGIDGLLNQIDQALKQLTVVTGPLGSALQATPVGPQVTALTAALGSDDPLTALIQALGVAVNLSTSADYNPPKTTNYHSELGLVDLKQLPAPLDLKLAPFVANAVPAAKAQTYNLAGPQVEAHNTTTSMDIIPTLAPMASASAIDSILTQLAALNLSGTVTAALGAADQGASAVQGVLAANPALAGLAGTVTTVTQTVNGTATQVVDTAPLQQLQSQLDGLTANLTLLKNLSAANFDINQLIRTDDVTSTATLRPEADSTVSALASTKLVDLKVLPLGGPLAQVTGNQSLLEVKGVSASSDVSLSSTHTPDWHDATSNLSEIDVLGRQIVGDHGLISLDQVFQGFQKPVDITVPGIGGLEILVTRGAHTNLDTATERRSSISALDIRISAINGANALLPFTSGFGTQSTGTGANALIADVALGNVVSDVTLNAPGACSSSCGTPLHETAAPVNPQTGMFGPMAAVGGAGLAGVAILMQLVPRLTSRRRRSG